MSHVSKQATIAPFRRQGSWEFEGGLREQAVRALELAEHVSVDLRKEWEAARARQLAGDKAAGRLVSRERIVERNLFTTAAVVLSAMAAEAFLNFYGVKRMGQEFYEGHYERQGLVPKLTGIVETCCGVRLDDDAKIISVARALSEARNRLAHPKTSEGVVQSRIMSRQPDETSSRRGEGVLGEHEPVFPTLRVVRSKFERHRSRHLASMT